MKQPVSGPAPGFSIASIPALPPAGSVGTPAPVQRAALPNRTGLPDPLKAGVEALSGLSLADVRVHRNSPAPARLGAFAYAKGSDIHLGPGQEHHLPHETWHVVQQKQGRVRATGRLNGGEAVNTHEHLETEADLMGREALRTTPSPPLADRAVPAPGPAEAATPLSPTAAPSAVVQGVLWEWNAHSNNWTTSGAHGSTSTAPARAGNWHGEQYEDTPYEQRSDPTVTPFLRSGQSFMGETGANLQIKGYVPHADHIRVTADHRSDLHRGSGLHEIVPTNLAGDVAHLGNAALIGAQSGARTSTSLQLLETPSGDVGAHTGFAPKPNSRGYTHTKGQAAAHDALRDAVGTLQKNSHRDEVLNEVMLAHLATTPHGAQVLDSSYLTGLTPNLTAMGTVGAPIANNNNVLDPNRLSLAMMIHRGRERVKRRVRAHKRSTGRGRSPSPPRSDIDSFGNGAGPLTAPTLAQQVEPTPNIVGTHDFAYAANYGAWLTQPMRMG